MIFQDPLSALNPVHRVGDQIVEMIQAHQDMSKHGGATGPSSCSTWSASRSPKARARQYPHEFSGGMRQRVMIAMAIANDPEVLIADEPTTALDVTVQAQILEVIQRIQRELSTAVVFITHDLGVIARVADRVQVMYAGRVGRARRRSHDLFDAPDPPVHAGPAAARCPRSASERLTPIPGAPPNMLQPAVGLRVPARCAYAEPRCARRRCPSCGRSASSRPRASGSTSSQLEVRAYDASPVLEVTDLVKHFTVKSLARACGRSRATVQAVSGVSFTRRRRARPSVWWARAARARPRSAAACCA